MMAEYAIVIKARTFATGAYAAVKHVRKYTGMPYITHPAEVARLVENTGTGSTPEMVAAAWLHDVVEDTGVTLDDIGREFGSTVALYVDYLTDAPDPTLNRAARKKKQQERLSKAPSQVMTIKLADIIDNTSTIMEHDPNFARIYMREKKELLFALHEGSSILLRHAMKIVADYEASLEEKHDE